LVSTGYVLACSLVCSCKSLPKFVTQTRSRAAAGNGVTVCSTYDCVSFKSVNKEKKSFTLNFSRSVIPLLNSPNRALGSMALRSIIITALIVASIPLALSR
jgi:hypothetical protein